MAKEKQPIIIKKKKGGHAGAHGGAWKVAYADFVTAMMAFFLVMWLMGSDEETRAAIEHYFNNPTSSWRKEMTSDPVVMGDMTGAGEHVLRGANGNVPEDLIERPSQMKKPPKESTIQETIAQLLRDQGLLKMELLRFSVPEEQLFKYGTLNEWTDQAGNLLNKIGELLKVYKGNLSIKAVYDGSELDAEKERSYEAQLNRAVSIGQYLVEHNYAAEERVHSTAVKQRRMPASDEVDEAIPNPRRIEFSLSKKIAATPRE